MLLCSVSVHCVIEYAYKLKMSRKFDFNNISLTDVRSMFVQKQTIKKPLVKTRGFMSIKRQLLFVGFSRLDGRVGDRFAFAAALLTLFDFRKHIFVVLFGNEEFLVLN